MDDAQGDVINVQPERFITNTKLGISKEHQFTYHFAYVFSGIFGPNRKAALQTTNSCNITSKIY